MSAYDPTTPYEFRPIPEFPAYRAGPDGVVQSCLVQRGRNVKWTLTDQWHDLLHIVNRDGYHFVSLRRDGKSYVKRVHRLVLECFVGQVPFPCAECRHLDGNPSNNWAWNLAWGTWAKNTADKFRHGTTNRGTRNGCAKLSDADVLEIERMYTAGSTQKEIADRYGVTKGTVAAILRGRTWLHVPRRFYSAREVRNGHVHRGEDSPVAKLRKSDVLEIRRFFANGESMDSLATRFDVTRQHIGMIVSRKAWASVP